MANKKRIKKAARWPFNFLLMKLAPILPDKLYLELLYFVRMGKRLNLEHPQAFTEKIQWLKLYNRNPEYCKMVDKYEAKKYVGDIIGEEHIIPTIGIYDSVEDIPWDTLPNQFVLKCTHDSGGIVICKDKDTLDIEEAKKRLSKGLKKSYFFQYREWPYKGVTPRIICEAYKVDESGYELKDYKFFCFNGKVKFLKVDFGRYVNHRANYYSPDGILQEFGEEDYAPDRNYKLKFPKNLREMISFSEILSKRIPFLRVDLYNVNGKIYFGELTFYPASGLGKFSPMIWDKKLGEMLILPKL